MLEELHIEDDFASRPARGEWIEILTQSAGGCLGRSRPARGEWIEIVSSIEDKSIQASLAPRGASGLKSWGPRTAPPPWPSRPARGEWIEISSSGSTSSSAAVSPREGRVD